MNRRDDNLFRMLRDAIFGNPIANQRNRVDKAILAEAEALGDVLVAKTMRDHYLHAATGIDHTQKWWDYANTRQKAQDYADEYELLVADHAAAKAHCDAEQGRYVLLLNGPASTGESDMP